MAAPGNDADWAPSAQTPLPSGSGIPNINPATGLSTDYLNHFSEAIMALEMAGTMPECLDDLRDWRPKSYTEHFAASRFNNREAAIRAYRAADPAVRKALDAAAHTLNAALAAARDELLRQRGRKPDVSARHTLKGVRPLVASMAALINGTTNVRAGAQATIDAMFGR
jgi:hypothetical protein